MKRRIIEENITIEDLVMLYEKRGKCHEFHAGKLEARYQKSEKPLAATRGNSIPNVH